MNFVEAKHAKPPHGLGYAFYPRKWELVSYFLKNKILGSLTSDQDFIPIVDHIYSISPNQFRFNDFLRGRKYENEWYVYSTRPDHKLVTGDGYYSVSAEEDVFKGNEVVGFMRILTYYQGWPPKGKKTNWILQELRVNPATIPASKLHPSTLAKVSSFVVCKIVLTDGIPRNTQREAGLFDSLIEEAMAEENEESVNQEVLYNKT